LDSAPSRDTSRFCLPRRRLDFGIIENTMEAGTEQLT
jgi:hypothetical protein